VCDTCRGNHAQRLAYLANPVVGGRTTYRDLLATEPDAFLVQPIVRLAAVEDLTVVDPTEVQ
jgi:hypothetical protein